MRKILNFLKKVGEYDLIQVIKEKKIKTIEDILNNSSLALAIGEAGYEPLLRQLNPAKLGQFMFIYYYSLPLEKTDFWKNIKTCKSRFSEFYIDDWGHMLSITIKRRRSIKKLDKIFIKYFNPELLNIDRNNDFYQSAMQLFLYLPSAKYILPIEIWDEMPYEIKQQVLSQFPYRFMEIEDRIEERRRN